jgi:Protein of unknown function (DUF2637)
VNATSLIRWSTVIAVTGIAGVAGWVSYEHALAVVRAHGESGAVAAAYPVTIDGLIYSASMVLLDSARRGVRAPALARWLLAVGIGATLVANVAAGIHFGVMGAVVAAWPALALVGSYELLMLIIRREAAPAAVTTPAVPDAIQAVTEAVHTGVPAVHDPVSGDVPVTDRVDVPEEHAPTAPAATVKAVTSGRAPSRASKHTPRTPERIFAAEISRGELPSVRQIKARAKVGTPKAQEIRAVLAAILREAHPEAA